ncbi:uncharacterized protein METZ01_LOCUS196202, partial [marine metagenome]
FVYGELGPDVLRAIGLQHLLGASASGRWL